MVYLPVEHPDPLIAAATRDAPDLTPWQIAVIVANIPPPRPRLCPVHGIPDCSPLLNGCSR